MFKLLLLVYIHIVCTPYCIILLYFYDLYVVHTSSTCSGLQIEVSLVGIEGSLTGHWDSKVHIATTLQVVGLAGIVGPSRLYFVGRSDISRSGIHISISTCSGSELHVTDSRSRAVSKRNSRYNLSTCNSCQRETNG